MCQWAASSFTTRIWRKVSGTACGRHMWMSANAMAMTRILQRQSEAGMRHLVGGLAAVLLLAAAPGTTHADPVADFYKGKSIRLIISGESGGTYDSDGRIVARHIGKHIPGNPSIVAENMLGAS